MKAVFSKGFVTGFAFAIVVLAVTAAWAGSGIGAVLNLGKKNSVDHQTALTGNAPVSMLKIQNQGAGTAANFSVQGGAAPFSVDSQT